MVIARARIGHLRVKGDRRIGHRRVRGAQATGLRCLVREGARIVRQCPAVPDVAPARAGPVEGLVNGLQVRHRQVPEEAVNPVILHMGQQPDREDSTTPTAGSDLVWEAPECLACLARVTLACRDFRECMSRMKRWPN